MTGACSAQSRPRTPAGDDTAGSLHPTRSCAGTGVALPTTGPNHRNRLDDPRTSADLRRLIVQMATQNPTWGYRRIHGELTGLGHRIAASTIWQIFKPADIEPAPQRSAITWSEFLRSQAAVACDFATIDTALLRRYYLLFFIDIPTQHVFFGGITRHPTGAWTAQAARNLFLGHADQLATSRALIRDRGSQFIDTFDEIFRTEGLKILKTPVRTPVANAFAERWIGTLRRELLDRTIIWNRPQLERLAVDYIDRYVRHEAPFDRVGVKGFCLWAVAAGHRSWGQSEPGDAGVARSQKHLTRRGQSARQTSAARLFAAGSLTQAVLSASASSRASAQRSPSPPLRTPR